MGRRPSAGIVFVHPSDELYGADRVLLEIVRSLPDEERAVSEVWLPTDLEHPANALCTELVKLGVTVRHERLPIMRRSYQNPRGLIALGQRAFSTLAALQKRGPGTVYCTTSAAFLAAPLARLARVPQVVGHLQEVWTPGDTRVIEPMARACHRLITVSSTVKQTLAAQLRGRAVVVENATPEPRSLLPLSGRTGPLRYVIASRWNGGKGHQTLLTAWEKAGAPGTLVVLGGPPGLGDAVDVHALAAALSRPDTVEIIGEVADPHHYLNEADVILVPSDSPEGFGLVAIEAFARARPAVTSEAGALVDIVTDGLDGWTFRAGDSDALAQVLAGLDREQVTRAGRAARQTFEARFAACGYAARWRRAMAADHDMVSHHSPRLAR